ncbi:hypothetical protein LTR65_009431 [Meristemomyces frigidus]
MVEPGPANLLALPLELRLQIYDHVCLLDTDLETNLPYPAFRGAERTHNIPWLNLMLACRTIGTELRRHFRSFDLLDTEDERRAYVVDLLPTADGSCLQQVLWRRIPCPPLQARRVKANLHGQHIERLQFAGRGGPSLLLRGLYQTLNYFIHCGRLLDSDRPLPWHVHLREVVVVFQAGNSHDEPRVIALELPKWHQEFEELANFLAGAVHAGFLYGFVDKITLTYGADVRTWNVEWKERVGLRERYQQYGFGWGIDTPHVDHW